MTKCFKTNVLRSERQKHVTRVFVDLDKAFDSLSRSIILKELKHFGIREKALECFESYFFA